MANMLGTSVDSWFIIMLWNRSKYSYANGLKKQKVVELTLSGSWKTIFFILKGFVLNTLVYGIFGNDNAIYVEIRSQIVLKMAKKAKMALSWPCQGHENGFSGFRTKNEKKLSSSPPKCGFIQYAPRLDLFSIETKNRHGATFWWPWQGHRDHFFAILGDLSDYITAYKNLRDSSSINGCIQHLCHTKMLYRLFIRPEMRFHDPDRVSSAPF